MVQTVRQKFSSQASPELLARLKNIALSEGRQFQAVLEDAMQEYIENQDKRLVRSRVMSHFKDSVKKNRKLGELLAK